jgi:phosphoserine aminotransferase
MGKVWNFSAGPAILPKEVLQELADEMVDYRGSGMSVIEMSHRGAIVDGIIKEAEKDLREVMNIQIIIRFYFYKVEHLSSLLQYQ